MICPKCSHEAISFSRFLFVVYPRHVTCKHCGAELTWSDKWRIVFHRSIIVTAICAVVLSVLRHATGVGVGVYIGVILVAVLIFDRVFWRSSTYVETP